MTGQSDGAWGELAQHDDDRAAAWDSFTAIPNPGENPALDAFVDAKHITHGALVKIRGRLADERVLVFAGPAYLKFRDVVSDRRWSYADSDWTQMTIVRHGPEPSATVIVAEGESDSARLTGVYECDVAIMPAGAGYFPDSYTAQLSGYELVLVGLDTDRAGEAGAATILAALPQAQRFAPPANDWCATAAEDLPPLPSPDDFERLDQVGGLTFTDLMSVVQDGQVPDPVVLVDDLLYTEGVHFFNGHPGSGKTTLVMHTAIMAMFEGRHLVWLDYEGGARPTARRLLACGCSLEWLQSRVHYAAWPIDAGKYLADVAARWPGALVVYDSASKALQIAGFDENSPSEVTQWATEIVRAAKTHELPVIIIDHVAKQANRSSLYGRGAGSKMADADVAWYVEKVTEFNRTAAGVICVHQQKDREGFLPFSSWYAVGDGAGQLTLVPIDEPIPQQEPDGSYPLERPQPSI